jgi:protein O-GlcNAc transferase
MFEKAPASSSDNAAQHFEAGNALKALGRTDEAVACFQQAIALEPDFAEAHINLGLALRERGQFDEAIAAYERALAIQPANPRIHNSLGNVHLAQARLDAATAAYRQALALDPDHVEARNNLGIALKSAGALDEAVACYRELLARKPDSPAFHSNLIFTLLYHLAGDAALARELRQWNEQHARPLAGFIQPHRNRPEPERRLRVGYVSPDFREHAAAFFLVPLLEHHDHARFQVHCYSSVPKPDAITRRLAQSADQWHEARDWDDARLAEEIRRDQIDILVDLTMHMGRNRLLMFARKPAPIQVAWLAYPGSTGLETMDYRITDPFLDPPGREAAACSETSVRLPETFWCYDPLTTEPSVNPLPAGERGYVTFGSLNNPSKLNEPVLRVWAQVLRAVRDSRLLLLAHEGSCRRHALDLLGAEGIAPGRVEFVGYQRRPDYLKLYHHIDVGLDTFPYNGHTTSFDSFWMGVPVITLAGQAPVGRAGVCALMNLRLPDLIARTTEEFVNLAAGWASDLPRLAALRSSLRERTRASPLMDAPRFARNLEQAYREMWRQWCVAGTVG